MYFSLAKCWFWKEGKIEKELEKRKWHIKIHEKMPFDLKKKKKRHFCSFGGTPMHFSLAKCWFWKGGKIERDFGKMKWQV